VVKSCLQDRRH